MLQLPDINVWLALVFRAHVHHRSALEWFDSQTELSAFFCRATQQGFLRLANNPKVLPGLAVSTDEAWRLFDQTLSDIRVGMCAEPEGLEPVWRQFTAGRQFTPKLWNDAYLAAFALTGGYELVTFDQGMTQYTGVRCVVLSG